MRGASALDRLLAEFPEAGVRVLVVWEPVLKSDIAAPLTRVLGLLGDRRVAQYWDPNRVVSADLVRSANEDPARYGLDEALPPGFVAWDVVAVFAKSAHWEHDLPVPVYFGGPVRDSIDATRIAIANALAGAISTPKQAPGPGSERRSARSAPNLGERDLNRSRDTGFPAGVAASATGP